MLSFDCILYSLNIYHMQTVIAPLNGELSSNIDHFPSFQNIV